MKITAFFLFLGIFFAHAGTGYSQGTKLTLNIRSATVREVCNQIEKQSNYIFVFSDDAGNALNKKINISANSKEIEEILYNVFSSTGLTYQILDKQVVVYNNEKIKEISVEPSPAPQPEQTKTITGKVTDQSGQPLPGSTVMVKGATIGTVTDADGNFTLRIPANAQTLQISFVGMKIQEIPIASRTTFNVQLEEEAIGLQEVVAVGYGTQKKESIVGAVSGTTSDRLERRGITSSLSGALSGQVPGVTVMETTGEPGANDPKILIRGQSTWNAAQPLILVDGVERQMIDVDVNEVESVSVLKDASATAVFGVKGANGVILVTTKRGKVGKAAFKVSADYGIKNISKIFTVMDAYEALQTKNEALEHELPTNETAWGYYMPYEQVLHYKKPQPYPYNYLYPNVDWADVMTKDFATSYRLNLNVSGGTEFAKYFGFLGYIHEGDILSSEYNTNKGYDPGYAYDRFNFRTNVDLNLTKSTTIAINLAGYAGIKKQTNASNLGWIYQAMYSLPPDAFPVKYEDGVYGKNPNDINLQNPVSILNENGISREQRSQITSDISIKQKLDFITKGLSASARVSYDLFFDSMGPDIEDGSNQGQALYKYVDPSILDARTEADSLAAVTWFTSVGSLGINEFDWVARPWTVSPEEIDPNGSSRALFYQCSLDYARTFHDHDVTAMILFNRRENATGSEFKHYREDWVGRITYGFKNKYLAEINGAYNGSEKFAPKYRFGFFPSIALGWMMSEETFMKNLDWLDKLKLRGSLGKVGSDAGIPRWAYVESWKRAGNDTRFTNVNGNTGIFSPYFQYFENTIPNADLHWETALKKNLGFEIAVLRNLVALNIDVFKDNRSDIFMTGGKRNIPAMFGADPVAANIGETETKGYEIELNLRKAINSNLMMWANLSMTKTSDKITKAEDPELMPDYLKEAGYAIGQTKTQIGSGFINNWDDVYASSSLENNTFKLPGDWDVIDFNADGLINSYDIVPYGFPTRPQKTYSTMIGLDYKNFSLMVQFYGQANIHSKVTLATPKASFANVSEYLRDRWTPDHTDAWFKSPRVLTNSPDVDILQFDGSFLRLKTVDISYKLQQDWVKNLGLSSARLYVQGNNLFFWSDLPTDIEGGSYVLESSYPMFRRINFGVNIEF